MKNKAIIILGLTLLILMITAVSANDVNSTDTVSTTDNFEFSVSENNADEIAVATSPNVNSENVSNNKINIEGLNETSTIGDELNVSDENQTSNFELEQSNNAGDSVQNKGELLGVTYNLTGSNDDTNIILNNSLVDNEDILTYSSKTFRIEQSDYYYYNVLITVEFYEETGMYYWDIDYVNHPFGGEWQGLYLDYGSGSRSLFRDTLTDSKYGSFSSADVNATNQVRFYSKNTENNKFYYSEYDYLPGSEADTSVSVTNPSVKYNSGTFSVSGTVTRITYTD